MLSGPAAMELKVWVDGIQRVVCGVSEQTTCQEVVIALAQAIGESPLGHTDPTGGPGWGPWPSGPVFLHGGWGRLLTPLALPSSSVRWVGWGRFPTPNP